MLGDRDLLDHVSLRSSARNLCRLFWRDLEIHHPGIDSLRLAPEVAQAWKERLAYIRAVDQQRKDAENRITAARATPAGERFLVAGQEFERCRSGQANRVYATELTTGRRRNLTHEEEAGFWSWATVEVLRHTVIRIEEMLELTHHSFIAYMPTTGEVVPMLQVAPSKTDAERLLLVSPELAEVLTAVIFQVRAGRAALPLVSAYDVFEQTWSPPIPFLFQRRCGTEDRPLTRSYIRDCLVATSQSAQITVAGDPLEWRPTTSEGSS
ncbi:hypothetical protein [Streptomyces sp. NPDC059513]|uniref:hypothetical protein n=1 Tax=unclassified Streptomyces TaxID=2593676 RepID=UPI0036B5DA77